jgi:hypothetical protein
VEDRYPSESNAIEPTKQDPPLAQVLRRLDRSALLLEERIQTLTVRLQPLLQSNEPTANAPSQIVPVRGHDRDIDPQRSPAIKQIGSVSARLEDYCERLQLLVRLLDV